MPKPKVLIIFPMYKENDSSHYNYWYQLFSQASTQLELFLLFESGEASTIPGIVHQKTQQITTKPVNLLERFGWILWAVLNGYRKIYIHYSYYSVFLCWLLKPFFKLKVYVWDCEKYTQPPTNSVQIQALRKSDVLVTGSKVLFSAYHQFFGIPKERMAVVPNWVKEEQAVKPKKLSQKKTHILFVHHLSPRKGSLELPAILQTIVEKKPDVFFHIIGNGPDFAYVKKQTMLLKENIRFYKNLPHDQVVSLFKAVDYFIMPSRGEGFPRVILETMIYQVPFVSTNVGNVSELVSEEQQNYIVPPQNPQLFAQRLIELMNNNTSKLVEKNYQRAREYNLSKASQCFVALFTHD
jgi:glycosyltransferase involved in cell wall biosynthesis